MTDPLSYQPTIPPNIMTYCDNEKQYVDFQNDQHTNNSTLAYDNEKKAKEFSIYLSKLQ